MSTDDDTRARDRESSGRSGNGHPVQITDPSTNVRELLIAAMARQDDLREQQSRYIDEIAGIRAAHDTYVSELRSAHEKELRQAESGRIDAIRAVDVGAVNRAAEVAATQAGALAAQLIATAEASRVQVAAAASASVTSLAAALEPIQKDIRDLRDAQSRGQGGKEQVVETRDVRAEGRLNANLVVGVVALLLTALIIAVAIWSAAHGG